MLERVVSKPVPVFFVSVEISEDAEWVREHALKNNAAIANDATRPSQFGSRW